MDELTWSYKGEVGKPVVYFETQTDWNQTLHTKHLVFKWSISVSTDHPNTRPFLATILF